MITIEQATLLKHGDRILELLYVNTAYHYETGIKIVTGSGELKLDKPIKWRVNGTIKLWKRDPARFQLPIKHGLYDYAYLTNDNACLFSLDNTNTNTDSNKVQQ
jgi:hypothetical protein